MVVSKGLACCSLKAEQTNNLLVLLNLFGAREEGRLVLFSKLGFECCTQLALQGRGHCVVLKGECAKVDQDFGNIFRDG